MERTGERTVRSAPEGGRKSDFPGLLSLFIFVRAHIEMASVRRIGLINLTPEGQVGRHLAFPTTRFVTILKSFLRNVQTFISYFKACDMVSFNMVSYHSLPPPLASVQSLAYSLPTSWGEKAETIIHDPTVLISMFTVSNTQGYDTGHIVGKFFLLNFPLPLRYGVLTA